MFNVMAADLNPVLMQLQITLI